ncbi:ECF transporter S component [Thermoanaerobacterium sp. RBIITD]|uniref:ECF transporter S component n=1 Tax=Thermoanaerobacterium sp. RBIITD TaxID=1550240 RepID=UPI000BB6AD58|nr:ECF transporter S component [Thermoanaerobacterium sp. RBIITD]SNX53094.1 Riboflavin transporter FmnP [Thermoanaerobacterium sp. RBIITD]
MEYSKTRVIVTVGLLSAIAFVLMYLEFQVPLFPSFLKFDFSDIPPLLASFALGPIYGIFVEIVKNVIHLPVSQTGGIGEIANFIVGSIFVYTVGTIYKKNKSKKVALIAMLVGTIAMAFAGSILNYYVFLPLYQKIMGWPLSAIIGMGKTANSHIVDLKTLISYGIFPFNILKGLVLSLITFLIYKKLSPMLHM